MGSTEEGSICQLGQARGMNKALDKMIQDVIAKTKNCENRVLAISHCNCPERAKAVKEKIEKIAKLQKNQLLRIQRASAQCMQMTAVLLSQFNTAE